MRNNRQEDSIFKRGIPQRIWNINILAPKRVLTRWFCVNKHRFSSQEFENNFVIKLRDPDFATLTVTDNQDRGPDR